MTSSIAPTSSEVFKVCVRYPEAVEAGQPDAVRFVGPWSWAGFVNYGLHIPTNDLVDRVTQVGANALRFEQLFARILEEFENGMDTIAQEYLDEQIYGQFQSINGDKTFDVDFWEMYAAALKFRVRLKANISQAYTDLADSFKDPVIAEFARQNPEHFGRWWSDRVFEHERYDVVKCHNGEVQIGGGLLGKLIPRLTRSLPHALRCRLVFRVESSSDPVEVCQIYQGNVDWSEFGDMYMEMETSSYDTTYLLMNESAFSANNAHVWPNERLAIRPRPEQDPDASAALQTLMDGLTVDVRESVEKVEEL